MAYIYPLTLDLLNLTGKHDDVKTSASKSASETSVECSLHLTLPELRLLFNSVEMYIDHLDKLPFAAYSRPVKDRAQQCYVVVCDLRDAIKRAIYTMEEMQ